ncbi:hypothetical protein [Paraburkholderia solisilvae]|uniref:Uncharacterized protein n=1 Tax=Paraburkholderia solisilvae TaxID=624376 RepID=A0A6J5D375_9BURK|nr:hypothetical protein [Paraburkholderia solisilvae]CAB3747764.1 hypothetical protein LMG29739_00392 [Paraburkholderia solisilvae]
MDMNVSNANSNNALFVDEVGSQYHPAPAKAAPPRRAQPAPEKPRTACRQNGVAHAISRSMAPSTGQQLKARANAPTRGAQAAPAAAVNCAHHWETSGACINGSVEYDLAQQAKQNVEVKRKSASDAEEAMNDAKTSWESAKGGPGKETLKRLYEQARSAHQSAQTGYDKAAAELPAIVKKHMDAASPYVAGKLGLDANNHLVRNRAAGAADWVYSASDTGNVLDEAATHAKARIDSDLANAWTAQVVDNRAWRDKHAIGSLDAENIDRQMYQSSEAYLLLKQNADHRKRAIDEAVTAFKQKLGENLTSVIHEVEDNPGKNQQQLIASMDERATNLAGTIADLNDQRNLFAALSSQTVNEMRVGTGKTTVPPYVSEQSGATHAEGQKDIDSMAEKIRQSARRMGDAEQAARSKEMPKNATAAEQEKIDAQYREAQGSIARELYDTTRSMAESIGNLTEEETLLGKWSVPGKTTLPGGMSLMEVGLSLKNFGEEISEYVEKSEQGTLTTRDKIKMADATRHTVGALVPYIPVVGPIITPFTTVANAMVDMIEDDETSPIRQTAAAMTSQTAKALTGDYQQIAPPSL